MSLGGKKQTCCGGMGSGAEPRLSVDRAWRQCEEDALNSKKGWRSSTGPEGDSRNLKARWDVGRQTEGRGTGCGGWEELEGQDVESGADRVAWTHLSLPFFLPPANPQTEGQLKWLSRRANALLTNGMLLTDNQLVVPLDGLYLIYSQVLFKGQGCPQSHVLLTHTVSRFAVSYQSKVNLLSAIKSPCQRETTEGAEAKPWYEPIYLGGVFQLEKGDRLSAEINLPEYLDVAEPGQVYFGIIAL